MFKKKQYIPSQNGIVGGVGKALLKTKKSKIPVKVTTGQASSLLRKGCEYAASARGHPASFAVEETLLGDLVLQYQFGVFWILSLLVLQLTLFYSVLLSCFFFVCKVCFFGVISAGDFGCPGANWKTSLTW